MIRVKPSLVEALALLTLAAWFRLSSGLG